MVRTALSWSSPVDLASLAWLLRDEQSSYDEISMAGFTPLNPNKTFTNEQLIALLSETPRVQPLGSANRYHHTAVQFHEF